LGDGRKYSIQVVQGVCPRGGINDPLIIHWPKGIADRGGIRHQFVDVIDITPTVLNLTGLKALAPTTAFHRSPSKVQVSLTTFKDASSSGRSPYTVFRATGPSRDLAGRLEARSEHSRAPISTR